MLGKDYKTRLSERVKRFLFARYTGGEASWTEDKLARRFHVSRTPIRDALRELEKQGILVRRQKRGIALRKPSAGEITEVYEVRAALEKLAVERAVHAASLRDIQSLTEIAHDLKRAVRKKDCLLTDRLDAKFHTQLIAIAGNQYLKAMVAQFDLLIQAFQLSTRLFIPSALLRAPGHEDIIDALAKRDKRRCRQLIDKHINASKMFLLQQLAAES